MVVSCKVFVTTKVSEASLIILTESVLWLVLFLMIVVTNGGNVDLTIETV